MMRGIKKLILLLNLKAVIGAQRIVPNGTQRVTATGIQRVTAG
jgi:hypothetical protein